MNLLFRHDYVWYVAIKWFLGLNVCLLLVEAVQYAAEVKSQVMK